MTQVDNDNSPEQQEFNALMFETYPDTDVDTTVNLLRPSIYVVASSAELTPLLSTAALSDSGANLTAGPL